ncbi:hypothetical protein DPMN_035991 [Dreissena polymorpha]|uniref:Uncharacterized protein n=1 Tax=Dreissena polymorpha TaxID=45954 RepID=A0A9D4M9W9_DREPO|nr:hypothetical protein DPMN_035991 [Dreissena polymorpha]
MEQVSVSVAIPTHKYDLLMVQQHITGELNYTFQNLQHKVTGEGFATMDTHNRMLLSCAKCWDSMKSILPYTMRGHSSVHKIAHMSSVDRVAVETKQTYSNALRRQMG